MTSRAIALAEDFTECGTIRELDRLLDVLREDPRDVDLMAFWPVRLAYESALDRVSSCPTPDLEPVADHSAELQQALDELKRLRQVVKPVVRATRAYRLLKTDVSWSTKPQVHAIMDILKAHVQVGEVVDEERIVAMMEANVATLQTVQGGRRVWNYYKGNSSEGLLAHGNLEKV